MRRARAHRGKSQTARASGAVLASNREIIHRGTGWIRPHQPADYLERPSSSINQPCPAPTSCWALVRRRVGRLSQKDLAFSSAPLQHPERLTEGEKGGVCLSRNVIYSVSQVTDPRVWFAILPRARAVGPSANHVAMRKEGKWAQSSTNRAPWNCD